jgi:transcriptional regulator with XRE-family HTH domain
MRDAGSPKDGADLESGEAPASPEDSLRRKELAGFLRTRRTRLAPEAHGLSTAGRRRTKGLRREEVARLLGVSPSWYTKLEQGLAASPSPRLLAKLADVLFLSPLERSELLRLGLPKASEGVRAASDEILPEVQVLIDSITLSPAFVLNPRTDYVASNIAARALFGDFESFYGGLRNQLLSLFLNENTRRHLSNWEESARRQVAMFRAAFARNIHDPSVRELVDSLLAQSAEFRTLWERHELPSQASRMLDYQATDGVALKLINYTFFADLDGNYRVEVFHPADAFTRSYLKDVVAKKIADDAARAAE